MNICLIAVESTISHYSAAVENDNANFNKIIFTMKDTKLYVPVITLIAKANLSKRFEKSVYWNKHKTKSENKNTINEFMCFLESNFVWLLEEFKRLFALVYSDRGNDVRRFKGQKYYLRKDIIKNYNVITNGKNICHNWFWYNTIWKNKKHNNKSRWRLCWTAKNNDGEKAGNKQSMLVSKILGEIKETRLKLTQGSVTVLQNGAN